MSNFTSNEYANLASMGITFDITPSFNLQPELIIISLLQRDDFIGNYMYGMLKLLFFKHHLFFRVDVLVKAGQNLPPVAKATLSALAAYSANDLKDKRFKKIKKYSLKTKLHLNTLAYIETVGAEPYLFERGVVVRQIPVQNEKKIQHNDWVFKNNIWFRHRLIFGLGVRADAFSILHLAPVNTYYELSKILGSSLFSARKSFQDFYKIKKLETQINI